MAEVANKLVFADAANQEARDLAADAYEQLGYWRSPPHGAMHILCRF